MNFVNSRTAPRWALVAVVLPCVLAAAGCKRKDVADAPEGPTAEERAEELDSQLLAVRVLSTPLELKVPMAWVVEDLVPAKLAAKPAPATDGSVPTITLTGRLLFRAKAAAGARGEWAAPRIEIFHDPWLPVGTSAADYLKAQRDANAEAVKNGKTGGVSKIRHVEAERSRRDGRPTYHVRDEWTFKFAGQRAVVSQESMLLVDKIGDDLHGYVVVLSLADDDREALRPLTRAIFDSIGFPDG